MAKRTQARRFITLIDAFYDKKVSIGFVAAYKVNASWIALGNYQEKIRVFFNAN